MPYAHGETVIVLQRVQGADDRYGNPTYTWPEPGTDVELAAVAPGTSLEPAQIGRSQVITGLVVYLPPGTDIGPEDRMRVRGVIYTVDGEPGDWRNPYTGSNPGIQVALTRWDG